MNKEKGQGIMAIGTAQWHTADEYGVLAAFMGQGVIKHLELVQSA